MESVVGRTVIELAEGVQRGEWEPLELLEAFASRIAAHDEKLGAFQKLRLDAARQEAQAIAAHPERARLPLAGVPIAIKDNVPVTGEPLRNGTAASSDAPSQSDHPIVQRLRAAGAVVIGLTRVPELCVFGVTDSVFGITRNPWNVERSAGGSSGGSAAAVAAGLVPAAHGNDGMGSLRVPAAACGLFTLKPGLGTVPSQLGVNSWFDMSENGPLTTNVADAARMLAVMAARPELGEFPEKAPLRIALSTKVPVPAGKVDPAWADAVRATGELLARAGHTVTEADPPYPTSVALDTLARWFVGTTLEAEQVADPSKLGPAVRGHARMGRLMRKLRKIEPQDRERWHALLAPFFSAHDVLITPTLAFPPLPAERWGERGWLHNMRANTRFAPFPAPWNFAGYPAASVPAGVHPIGTPLAVQLVAPLGQERRLLGLARELEALRPWTRIAPAFDPSSKADDAPARGMPSGSQVEGSKSGLSV